jgi:pimeloyl-ACP methyl ester carboxylesterase
MLVASFAKTPSLVAKWVAATGADVFRVRPPDVALRWALLGMDADDHHVRDVRSAMESVDALVLAARLKAIATVDVTAEFAAVSSPLLYIAGRRDRLVGPRVRTHLKAVQPGMEIRVLDAPHLVLQRCPAEAATLISDFLRRDATERRDGVPNAH